MRTTLVGFLAGLLVLSLFACHSGTPSDAASDTTQASSEADSEQTQNVKEITCYQNPVMTAKSENAWENYGFGDPFVMRHNGTYYLYASTKDLHVGIKCWSSRDLINWSYCGLCTTEVRSTGAYAPEVYYYNGYFYMYTSPAGNGHYVLRSTSPTEGFEVVTDNMGMSIDGSVFVDNDGKWYFYTANYGQMMVYDMPSPTTMRNGRTLPTVSVNGGWTEGPMTVYHDGYYYMTYTGNHVLSRSYRINYAVSTTSPVAFDGIEAQNPLLIHTTKELYGIGHSSTVKGPDLDSYYIVYHSLVDSLPCRNMNVDRIVFNGDSMQIMGPHDGKQQVPSMPDIYHDFAPGASLTGWALQGGFGSFGTGLRLAADTRLVSKQQLEGDFTAEYNVTAMQEGAQAGALFAYADAENYGACYFDAQAQCLHIEVTVQGQTHAEQVPLIHSFGEDVRFDCLQALQIERSGDVYTFYFNDRLLCNKQITGLSAGAVGYVTRGGEASFGFIGATGAVGGRGAADEFHCVGEYSGLIPASHYADGDFEIVKRNGVYAVSAPEGSELSYYVLAQKSGSYDMALSCASARDTELEILVDGEVVSELHVPACTTQTVTVCRGISMRAGQHTLTLRVCRGEISPVEYRVLHSVKVVEREWTFDAEDGMYLYSDGTWKVNGSLRSAPTPSCGKRLFGSENWGDYAVSVSVTPTSGIHCGLLVRAAHPGSTNYAHMEPTPQEAAEGTDWLYGYYVGLTREGVVLGKQRYGSCELASAPGSFSEDTSYLLRAECEGATVRVYVDGVLYLEYTDPDPYMHGMVGVRVHHCAAEFDDLHIEPLGQNE